MTSLLNDEKCVKMLAVYARFCTQAYMGIYLVVWYLNLNANYVFFFRRYTKTGLTLPMSIGSLIGGACLIVGMATMFVLMRAVHRATHRGFIRVPSEDQWD